MKRITDPITRDSAWGCLNTYRMYPIREVRDLCLARMDNIARNSRARADCDYSDFESLLRELILEIMSAHDGYTSNDSCRFISILAFMGESYYPPEREGAARQQASNLEFAIRLYFDGKVNRVRLNDIAKPVLSRLIETPSLYKLVPSVSLLIREVLMDTFCLKMLRPVTGRYTQYTHGYQTKDWEQAERALKLIQIVEDTSLIDAVEELSIFFKAGRIMPYQNENGLFNHQVHVMIFTLILRQLRGKKLSELCPIQADIPV